MSSATARPTPAAFARRALGSRLGIISLTFLSALAHNASGQGNATVPPDDPAYRAVDRLIDRGLVTHVIVGQRPYSRAVMAMIARGASVRLDSLEINGSATLTIDRAAVRTIVAVATGGHSGSAPLPDRSGLASAPVRVARLDALLTDAPTRSVPSNGLGSVEADLNTFTDNSFGERRVTGMNVSAQSEHWIETPHVAVQARPRLWLREPRNDSTGHASAELLALSARALQGNVSLTVGREYTFWSPDEKGGLFFGANAPALDMIRVASDAPFVLPGLLRHLGDAAATIQVADLGASVNNSHSLLVSYKVSVRPTDAFEAGATFFNHFGGSGARGTSAFNRFVDLVPLLDVFRHHADSTDVSSDKLLGLDARLRLARLAGVTLFGELALEDFDRHRLYSIFHEDAAYSLGIVVPQVVLPALSARLSVHSTGIRFYEHHLITNGIAARRFLLGDELGHQARGASALLRWERATGAQVTGNVDVEERRNDFFDGTYVNPDQTGLVFRTVQTLPVERRARAVLSASWFTRERHLMLRLSGGLERVANFGFVQSPASTHGVASAGAALYP